MKLEATDYEIVDDQLRLADISIESDGVVEINIIRNVFDLDSWREFSLLVEQAIIKLTEQDNDK